MYKFIFCHAKNLDLLEDILGSFVVIQSNTLINSNLEV